jgi:hypothetical protein
MMLKSLGVQVIIIVITGVEVTVNDHIEDKKSW